MDTSFGAQNLAGNYNRPRARRYILHRAALPFSLR